MKVYKVFRMLSLIIILLLLGTGLSEAGKTDWRDDKYNFKAVQTAWVEDIDLSGVKLDNDILPKRLQEYYHQQETRPHWQVLTKTQLMRKMSLLAWEDLDVLAAKDPEAFKARWAAELPKFVNVYVTAALTRYDESSYVIPAHTEWESRTEEDTYTDDKGKEHTVTHTYEVPVFVPDQTVWVSHVTVRFDLHDAATGAVVFSREDVRHDTDSMEEVYQLSVRSFFRELELG